MALYFQLQDSHNDDDDNNDDDDTDGDDIGNSTTRTEDNDEAVKWFEKLVRVHQPPHPTSWRSYIRYVMGRAGTTTDTTTTTTRGDGSDNNVRTRTKTRTIGESPGVTVARLRCVRGLYHRSMATVKGHGRRKGDAGDRGEDEGEGGAFRTAMVYLCEEYMNFERRFGLDGSVAVALKLTRGKLAFLTSLDGAGAGAGAGEIVSHLLATSELQSNVTL